MSGAPARGGGSDEGFTLVETIVAFAILALIMTAAVQVIGGGSVRARFAEAEKAALSHAEAELERLAASGQIAPGATRGAFDNDFHWTRTASRLGVGDDPLGGAVPFFVRLEVTPVRSQAAVRLSTILLVQPEQAP